MNDSVTILQKRLSDTQDALLLRFTGMERVRIWHDWYHVSELVHGQLVDEISYLGRHSIEIGNALAVRVGRNETQLEVLSLRYIDCSSLSEDESEALGYQTLEDYEKAEERSLPQFAWYVVFARFDAESYLAPPEAGVLEDVLTTQEAALLFNLSESTIRVNIHRGNLPARKSGGTWLIRRADAEKRWSLEPVKQS